MVACKCMYPVSLSTRMKTSNGGVSSGISFSFRNKEGKIPAIVCFSNPIPFSRGGYMFKCTPWTCLKHDQFAIIQCGHLSTHIYRWVTCNSIYLLYKCMHIKCGHLIDLLGVNNADLWRNYCAPVASLKVELFVAQSLHQFHKNSSCAVHAEPCKIEERKLVFDRYQFGAVLLKSYRIFMKLIDNYFTHPLPRPTPLFIKVYRII